LENANLEAEELTFRKTNEGCMKSSLNEFFLSVLILKIGKQFPRQTAKRQGASKTTLKSKLADISLNYWYQHGIFSLQQHGLIKVRIILTSFLCLDMKAYKHSSTYNFCHKNVTVARSSRCCQLLNVPDA